MSARSPAATGRSSVPSWCTFDMRVGVLPSQTLKECRQEVEDVIRRAAANDPFLGNNPPTRGVGGLPGRAVRAQEPRAGAAACWPRRIRRCLARRCEDKTSTGTADNRFFGLYAGIPAPGLRPAIRRHPRLRRAGKHRHSSPADRAGRNGAAALSLRASRRGVWSARRATTPASAALHDGIDTARQASACRWRHRSMSSCSEISRRRSTGPPCSAAGRQQ